MNKMVLMMMTPFAEQIYHVTLRVTSSNIIDMFELEKIERK